DPVDQPTTRPAADDHFFRARSRNSNNAFVAGSSGRPRSALILLWVVSRAPKTVTGTPASFSTWPSRWACALTSGCPATCRTRNGGVPLHRVPGETAWKSCWNALSLHTFSHEQTL